MDYEIRKKTSELDSTGYMEIGPGKYSGKHWQDGFLFVWEDAFGMAEGIVMKYFKDYDHFGMNDIPKEVGTLISSEWFRVATLLETANPYEYQELLNLDSVYRTYIETEVSENKEPITMLLLKLSNSFKQFYTSEDWVCILGM